MAIPGYVSQFTLTLDRFPGRSESLYYLAVTAHGVLMALVFTTFFIIGLGYVLVGEALGRITALYTFYPPLQAHPLFYIGATFLVVGSWIWGGIMIAGARAWGRSIPALPGPLSVHGMLAAVIVWYLATAGLAAEVLAMLIPWSLGLVKTIDPAVARTLFWWFGHPLVYFWLIPAYVLWYTVAPKVAGGRLFSDPLARMVFGGAGDAGLHVRWLRRRDQRRVRNELHGSQHGLDPGPLPPHAGHDGGPDLHGATCWMLPRLLGRELRPAALARVQPWLWFLGVAV
jgi:heme/copper-type cytochrome/quinol oxidase subunit 1